jgi:hypothetical protein
MKISGTCHACHESIFGQVITAMGHDWHPDHFICRGCSRSIKDEQFYVGGDRPYHSHCYVQSVAKRCAYCQAPLLGGYLVDYFGAAFCPIHAQQYPACTFCGRLVPTTNCAGAACSMCRRAVVASREEAKRPVETVWLWLANRGIVLQTETVSLELCNHSKLTSLSNARVGSKCLGVTRTTLWNPVGNPSSVGILSGLPVTVFKGVVAHEFGHAWLHQNGVHDISSKEAEGLCELLSFCFYKEAVAEKEGPYHAEAIARNPDAVYGDGFRLAHRHYLRTGLSSLFQFVKINKRFPG